MGTIDTYTKIILTIIAVCLLWICVRDNELATSVHAQSPLQEVIIAGVKESVFIRPLPVSIQEISVIQPGASYSGKQPVLPIYGDVRIRQ